MPLPSFQLGSPPPASPTSPMSHRRHSSITSRQPQHEAELQPLLEALEASAGEPILTRLQHLILLQRALLDSPEAKDTFRLLKGFPALLATLHSLAGFFSTARSAEDSSHFIEFVKSLLGVLAEALLDHPGNRRFFARRIGWDSLQAALAATGLPTELPDHMFGVLLALAMDDGTYTSLVLATKRALRADAPGERSPRYIRERVQRKFGVKDTLLNAEVMPVVFGFWAALGTGEEEAVTRLVVVEAVRAIAEASEFNLVALHGTGVLSAVLARVWDAEVPAAERKVLRELAGRLIQLGVNRLEDARELYRKAMTSEEVAEFLLEAVKASRQPPHIQFDLSLHGYASLELPSLGKTFPPTHTPGYSFAAWIYVDTFDPAMHTTIFGVFDSSQKCFILAYIEQDTRRFILQTSTFSSRASVRFKSVVFEPKRWYHITIAHRRGKATVASKAALYVDGEFMEQTKITYPQSPPTPTTPVQFFIGTPSELSPRVGRGVVNSRWRIGTAHMFEDILSDDLIAVYYRLGPRYHGNFQDSLGQYMVFESSAILSMRNDLLHPGREEKSDLITAVRQKLSGIMPEGKIILSISATQVLDDKEDDSGNETPLLKSLSRHAAKNLQALTRSGAIAINGAAGSLNEALLASHGTAVLTGSPVVAVPASLDLAAWRIGGTAAVCLKLVEAAVTPQQVHRAVEILFEITKDSWRNNEAMEREEGFRVLSYLIRQKEGTKGVINRDLLRLFLGFVGYDYENPEDSLIINQYAYKTLIIDCDFWRRADIETQKEYYAQFVALASGSKYHHTNAKRLIRQRAVKQLLFAFKGENFSKEIIPDLMRAFKVLLKTNMTAEALRNTSLFIVWTLHRPLRTLKNRKSNSKLRRPGTRDSTTSNSSFKLGVNSFAAVSEGDCYTKQQLGVMVFEQLRDVLCEDPDNTSYLLRFSKIVTHKVLLHFLADTDATMVTTSTQLLARLLVFHGPSYVKKFAENQGGFVMMRNRLKRWWSVPQLWPICFAILFGKDIARIDVNAPMDLCTLLEAFSDGGKAKVVYPEILPVIASMLKAAVSALVSDSEDTAPSAPSESKADTLGVPKTAKSRRRAMSVNDQNLAQGDVTDEKMAELTKMIQSVIQFIAHLHSTCPDFREFCVSSSFLEKIFGILFPVICSSDHVSAETELNSRDSALTFDGGDVVIRPLANTTAPPIVRTVTVDDGTLNAPSTGTHRLRRGSSFILVTQEPGEYGPSTARLTAGVGSGLDVQSTTGTATNMLVESLMELIMAVFLDQIFERRDFQGFALNIKVPPGFQEHQIYFETYLLRNVLSHLTNAISFDMKRLTEPKVLTNIARFAVHITDIVYEGWFLNGAEVLLDFVGMVLEYLQRSDVAKMKSVRLCTQSVSMLRSMVSRIVLFRLSEVNDPATDPKQVVAFLNKIMYWQTVILSPDNTDAEFTKLICYLLYTPLIDERYELKRAAADMLRIVLVQKPDETSALLNQARSIAHRQLSTGFSKLMEVDNDTWLYWIDDHRKELDEFFYGSLSKSWETFVLEENRKTEEIKQIRITKRKEKLKEWIQEDMTSEDIYGRHSQITANWLSTMYYSVQVKFQRALQDKQDDLSATASQYAKLEADLTRPCGLLDDGQQWKWRLDMTEGRNRMRKRMLPDRHGHLHNYQPKRRLTTSSQQPNIPAAPSRPHALSVGADELSIAETTREEEDQRENPRTGEENYDDYDLCEEDYNEPDEEWEGEDKMRKVVRSMHRGEKVESVHNVSRLIGLDTVEGLLVMGQNGLYLMDNYFQRSDGEIVDVWHAPKEERDQYLQMLTAQKNLDDKKPLNGEHDTRSWAFEDLVSISKRRFLFRDVGLELFFADGRSYLLTTMSAKDRDALHSMLLSKAGNISNTAAPWIGDIWSNDAVAQQDRPSNFGSKLANVFTPGSQNPATKKWIKGEISNFHYLMLVNTMAGRTFNDLTQYPVFPWVLADYTSEELDLTNPRTFRDFSRPMGAQTPERQKEFRDRYRSFEEINDQSAPPFHYGTHFSSAMIVCSYLIRLQPFVKSYLILQGGQFDHADRLFHSIEKAWTSASRDNMTDVRELIPEFFFLPEFLTNANGYNFGLKQGTDEPIDDVVLPPWAKGDPKIFIQKHREALESPYVTAHLHEWIDLVFGFKQRGEAAVESTNVFHHLSYHGAIDLDKIDDEVERLATIGIIHNFGQTPHQVFTRPHPQRDPNPSVGPRLDLGVESLVRLPFPLLDSHEKVEHLDHSPKHEKVFCSGATRLNMPPTFDKYVEWGFPDCSLRFFTADTKKLIGIQEQAHAGQVSCAKFADPRTLVTAGTDGTVTVWHVSSNSKSVQIHNKATLFGHYTPVTTIALSRSFSTVITASTDATVILWDLNRLRFIRRLPASPQPIACAAVNDVTGDLLLASTHFLSLFTINGDLIVQQNVGDGPDDAVLSAAFYEGAGNEWIQRELLLTGHKRGIVNIWEKRVEGAGWKLRLVRRLQHINQYQSEVVVRSGISAVLPRSVGVWTGDEGGRVYEWDCQAVQRHDSPVMRR